VWVEMGASVDAFPMNATLPVTVADPRPHYLFRGLVRLYSHCGLPDRSTAQGGPCREAPAQPVTEPNRSPATGLIDIYPGGPPPLEKRAIRGHTVTSAIKLARKR
jgi:hypothetical protein